MEFKIIIDTQNPLFNRREIEGEVHAEVTPSRAEVAQILAKKFSADIETIKIRTIKGRFGSKTFVVVANIYASKKDKDKIEAKSKRDAKQSPRDDSGEPEVKTEALTEEASKKEEPETEKQPKEEKVEANQSLEEEQPEAEEKPVDEEETS